MTTYTLLKDLGVFTAILGAITWLANVLGKHLIDKNLKIHELMLDKQLEKYKSELLLINEKESKLHDRRLDRIQELYSLLTDFYIDLDTLTRWKNVTGMGDEEIKKQQLDEAKQTFTSGHEFSMFYEKNKLYFNPETCATIEELLTIMRGCQYDLTIQYQWMNLPADLQIKHFEQARDQLRTKVPELKQELEKNFRAILRVE